MVTLISAMALISTVAWLNAVTRKTAFSMSTPGLSGRKLCTWKVAVSKSSPGLSV